jgi:uncharacterized protein YndB with AHSA1/START domain
MKSECIGKWRISEMEQWDQDFIDLVVPGYINFETGGDGSFQFGAVEGEIDCRIEKVGNVERLEFTWPGYDESDPVCGRGWVVMEGNELRGRLYFHLGDDSGFKAKRGK